MSSFHSSHSANNTSVYKHRASKRRKTAQKNPESFGKIQEVLEHIVATGTSMEGKQRKRQKWEEYQRDRAADADAATSTTASKKVNLHTYFAEDIRLYGSQYDCGPGTSQHNPSENGYPMRPWPCVKQGKDGAEQEYLGTRNKASWLDGEWNIEYGDSIPPIYFSSARLSQLDTWPNHESMTETANNNNNLDWTNAPVMSKSLQSTDISVPLQQVPQALLERCWTRAVQAASNIVIVPTPADTSLIDAVAAEMQQTQGAPSSPQRQPAPPIQRPSAMVEAKCRSLGIALDNNPPPTQCPRCCRDFADTKDLAFHFYGSVNNSEITGNNGCCQAWLRRRQLQTIDHILKHCVESHTNQLLDIVLTRLAVVAAPAKQSTYSKSKKALLEWKDILSFLEEALSSSVSCDVASETAGEISSSTIGQKEELIETILTNDAEGAMPLVLNKKLLKVVKQRLLNRYAC